MADLDTIKKDARFLKWIDFIFQWECVYDKKGNVIFEDDPSDSGGLTKYGVDQRSHPKVDIKNLTRDQALQIYYNEYWLAVKADRLPYKIAVIIANIGVNTGKGNASHWLQNALKITSDGIIGPNTIDAANKADVDVICDRLLIHLEGFYKSIATGKNQKFLKGWLNRTNSLRKFITTL